MALSVHSLLPDSTVRCGERDVPQATTEAKNVTCKKCLAMMEKAQRAAEVLREAWRS